MAAFPSALRRAFEGLRGASGRTILIAGPPFSGKSKLLEDVAAELEEHRAKIVRLRGTYREREVPYSALTGLEGEAPPRSPDGGPKRGRRSKAAEEGALPSSGLAFIPEEPVEGRRRGAERRKGVILGQTYVTRARAAESRDPAEYWDRLSTTFEHDRRPIAILVEDGCFVDLESRQFLEFLSERARLRPVLLIATLDTEVPTFAAWEERFLGRGDVDWIRFRRPKTDPRETRRLNEAFEKLPDPARRVVGFAALMGGSVGEVNLGRVTRLSFQQLADALLPATMEGLAKVEGSKVVIPHDAWVPLIPDLIPEMVRRDMHREIAEALAALSPEPKLERRLELANHYYEWYEGPNALRYLLETAELTEQLSAFDTSEELIEKALRCVRSLPQSDRAEAEAELRLFRARVLVACGRLDEAEQALREGIVDALHYSVSNDRLEEWVEALVPGLRAAGPRPTLGTLLMELAERCHASGATATEVLFQSLLSEFDLERSRFVKARTEANRAAALARSVGRGPVQSLALLAVASTLVEGTPAEQELAGKFLQTAQTMLGTARRYGLEYQAEEFQARLVEARGDKAGALRLRERAIPTAQRNRELSIELGHQLGVASLLLEQNPDARLAAALKRAHEIADLLHLIPPAPGLLSLWVLEGRMHAQNGAIDHARDRWRAVADLPAGAAPPRVRAEALVRLSILEVSHGREERARAYLTRLGAPDLADAMRAEWKELLPQLRLRASNGGDGVVASTEDRGDEVREERQQDREPADDRQDHDDPPL